MKQKLICILLVLSIFTVLYGCGSKNNADAATTTASGITTSYNPNFVDIFGAERMQREEITFSKLVEGLENCYEIYTEDHDLYKFGIGVESYNKQFTKYTNNYLYNLSEELEFMSRSETDTTRKLQASNLSAQCTMILSMPVIWGIYKFQIEESSPITHCSDEEVEEALFSYINDVSQFFYYRDIVEQSKPKA